MLTVLLLAFSCSYDDDETDEDDKTEKRAEAAMGQQRAASPWRPLPGDPVGGAPAARDADGEQIALHEVSFSRSYIRPVGTLPDRRTSG